MSFLGVRQGAQVSNVFTVAKLLPLLAICFAGEIFLFTHTHTTASISTLTPDRSAWLKAVLLLVFAYEGFEGALVSAGEALNPRRDASFASLLTCIVVYTLIQWVALSTVPGLAHSDRPLSDTARNLCVSFAWNVTLSAIARLFYYGACCMALPVLREKMPGRSLFRLLEGAWVASTEVLLCAVPFTGVDRSGWFILLTTVAVASVNWLVVRGKQPPATVV